MTTSRKGFALAKSQGAPYAIKTFKVVATANNAYYLNDPVKMEGATGLAERVTASSATLLGVVIAAYKDSNGQKRPLTHSQPTNGPYLTSGQAGFVEVVTDPRARFIAAIDTSASAGLVGKYIGVTAGAPNQRTGLSGYGLKASTATAVNIFTTTAGATLYGRPFQIVEISDFETAQYGRNIDIPADAGVVVKLAVPLLP
jgi:hypothetical protein